MNKAELQIGDRVSVKGGDDGHKGTITKICKGDYYDEPGWMCRVDWDAPDKAELMGYFTEEKLVRA